MTPRPAPPPPVPDPAAEARRDGATHINGHKILGRQPPCRRDTHEWSQLTKAALEWREAGKTERFGPGHQRICRHAAEEIEILRDYGFEIQIEPRCVKKA
jgi:hypothetical protein